MEDLNLFVFATFVIALSVAIFLTQYWYLSLIIVAVVIPSWKILPKVLKTKYENELKKLHEKRKEIQKKYFVEQSVDEETFRQLDTEIDEQVLKLKSKLEKKKISKE